MRESPVPTNLYEHTSGRYVCNKNIGLAERLIKIDFDVLRTVVSRCFDGARVADVHNLTEGGFNRVLQLALEDNREIVIKIPYKITAPDRWTTQSGTATLQYLSSQGIPVPGTDCWSSNKSNNVGTDYIIMEKALGTPLNHRWYYLNPVKRLNLMKS